LAGTRFRKVLAAATTVALGVGLLSSLGPQAGLASSHREAPLTAADPQIDNTDVYAFRSPDRPNTVTLVSSWIPFEEPAGGPNFYLWAEHTNYDIKIDNNGDAKPDITYRWIFTTHYANGGNSFLYNNGPVDSLNDPNLLIRQTYDLYRMKAGGGTKLLLNNAPVAPSNVGDASMPAYNSELFDAAVKTFGDAPSKSWVGQSDDPFFLDLRVFDLLYGANLSEVGDDTLAGFNVNTFALQVPISRVTGSSGQIIGVWSTASRPGTRVENGSGGQAFSGGSVQVSRLGNPLVNEVVIPVGLKDYFNSSKPTQDGAAAGLVTDPELPHVINAVYPSISVPDSDNDPSNGIQRDDLVSVFLTGIQGLNQPANVTPSEMLRLNLATPLCDATSSDPNVPDCDPLGVIAGDVQGYPNGRRLSDDVIDISLRVVIGKLLGQNQPTSDTIGDGVDANDVPFLDSFPYVAHPHSGSDPNVHVPAP
jgi:hypothetical protein